MQGSLHCYIDLHAHASRRGVFVFGNNYATEEEQVQAVLYPKLVSMNTQCVLAAHAHQQGSLCHVNCHVNSFVLEST